MRKQEVILGALFILPVAAAHYFSIEESVLALVSALISVCLWVALITLVSAKITNPLLHTVAGIVLATLLALYFFGQLISYYLQGSYFNAQFFFHMNVSSITETWLAYYPLVIFFVSWMACIWLVVWINRNRPATGTISGFYVVLILALAILFDPGLRTASASAYQSLLYQQDESLNSIEWEKLHLDRKALESSTGAAHPGKNLVMVFLEGFDKLYTDEAVFPNLTPNILALNAQGWQLENLRQMQGTGWTMAGLVSSLCGTPLLHEWEIQGNNIMFTEFLNRAVCLPDVLRAAGYKQTFMGGASLVFAGKGVFLNQHSFDHVYGRSELKTRLPDPSYLGGWGLYDDSLFDLAVQEFNAFTQENEPFNLTLLTIDTHHPAGAPSQSCPKYSEIDNSILHAVHCTDYLVGRFIEQLQSNPAYSDTLIVLLADHIAMRNDAFSLFPPGYDRRLYFNVLNSGLQGSSNVLAMPMDVAPTILSLLGVKHNASFLAGRDITSIPDGSPPYKPNDPQRLSTLAYLNSNYLTTTSDTQRHAILFDAKEYVFKKDIDHVEFSNGKVTFTATGKDPYFILPEFDNDSDGPMTMVIDLDAPAATITSIFYITSRNEEYSFDRARHEEVKAGNNRLVLPLPADADYAGIKVDPGSIEGEYTIHSIEIQQ